MINKLQKTFSPDDTLYAKDMNSVTGKIDEVIDKVNNVLTEEESDLRYATLDQIEDINSLLDQINGEVV